jgi:hypothetical protein
VRLGEVDGENVLAQVESLEDLIARAQLRRGVRVAIDHEHVEIGEVLRAPPPQSWSARMPNRP